MLQPRMPTALTLSAHLCCPDCHAALLSSGDDPAPAAFDPTLSEKQVLKAVKPYIQ